jgi:hypothetical protein
MTMVSFSQWGRGCSRLIEGDYAKLANYLVLNNPATFASNQGCQSCQQLEGVLDKEVLPGDTSNASESL